MAAQLHRAECVSKSGDVKLLFTTNAYPKQQRRDAWSFVLQRYSFMLHSCDNLLYGELASFKSSQDVQFIRIASTAQSIQLNLEDDTGSFWLILVQDGTVTARSEVSEFDVHAGDIIYGGVDVPVLLQSDGEHRMLVVLVPASFSSLMPGINFDKDMSPIAHETPIGRMMAGLLDSVAETIVDLTDDHIRPVETALPSFMSATLMHNAPVKERGGTAGAKAALLERIYHSIEMRLGDPELNADMISKEHGLSTRYLQKLFEAAGDSVSQYIKNRRLERCRLDLRSPLHAQRSISEILFQWGFNDSATFSRSFREKYGMSPRDYRRAPPEEVEIAEVPQRGRPPTAKDQQVDPHKEDKPGSETEKSEAPYDGVQNPVRHHHLPASVENVHWGYFSSALKPALSVRSGDFVTIETLTHHAYDDYERMIEGDAAVEAVFEWTPERKAIERRGAGPMDASVAGRGAGEGFGVHICTGPIEVQDAAVGDVLEIRILDINPRPSGNPRFMGRSFGSNVAAYWGYHYGDMLTDPVQREVVTIYEIERAHGRSNAHAVYNFRWKTQTDPSGVAHERYDYPGVPVDHDLIEKNYDVLSNVEIPVRPHFGVIGVAPPNSKLVDSVPPSNYGGNLDNWRIGPGSSLFLPVGVPGALLSLGDPHASQGDSELCGTAIECSMTAMVQLVLHPASGMQGQVRDLDYPLLETRDEWVIFGFSYPNYLKELGNAAQSEIYKKSSIDLAMRDCFHKVRRFLMSAKGLDEDEAISLISVGVDFGISQVANGNWGVHALIRKEMFTS
ncbi:acetamidase/formamidase family protein [Hyphococcus sp. DH-69]|uniref:acetamidase/formamidase family protein n=1 Tax=Hyphococcus formosus TaxID=3143534 RepID=UPI00398B306F